MSNESVCKRCGGEWKISTAILETRKPALRGECVRIDLPVGSGFPELVTVRKCRGCGRSASE